MSELTTGVAIVTDSLKHSDNVVAYQWLLGNRW